MNATFTNYDVQNLAIGGTSWTLSLDAAKALSAQLKADGYGPGSYWHANVIAPTRSGVRAKRETVSVWTAGFATGELSNKLHALGVNVVAK